MALHEPSAMAQGASILVAAIAAVMATMAFLSYRRTGNSRLLFVVAAFATYVAKGLFAAYNLQAHDIGAPGVPHDMLEFSLALFDVVIVVLFFIPFVTARRRARRRA